MTWASSGIKQQCADGKAGSQGVANLSGRRQGQRPAPGDKASNVADVLWQLLSDSTHLLNASALLWQVRLVVVGEVLANDHTTWSFAAENDLGVAQMGYYQQIARNDGCDGGA